MKIALAQINPVVGDLHANATKIVQFAEEAHGSGADLVVFPELCVTGYPPMDLLDNAFFVDGAQRITESIARDVPRTIGVIVGAPVPNEHPVGKRLFNAALLLHGGKIHARVHKTLLPSYDVFDEYRYFQPASYRSVVHWNGMKLGIHLCEDMWNNEEQAEYHLYDVNPIRELVEHGADLLINISASPFSLGKHALRNKVIRTICTRHGVPFAMANQVGANTEIIFDGDSRVHDAEGNLIRSAASFEEELLIWDTQAECAPSEIDHEDLEDLHAALVLGIRDYFFKTGFFNRAVVGLSGGIDSAVTCALAVEALGKNRVIGITMPSRYSSDGSVNDSRRLAETLGIEFHEISIQPAVDAFENTLQPLFAGTSPGVAEENLQARARGVTLMAVSNKFDDLLLTTGNKSELAVGYATLYGDMMGGLAVLADVYKTQVYALSHYINRAAGSEIIPENTIRKPPSAELRPNQTDQDSLPPYDVLDDILKHYIEHGHDVVRISAESGYDRVLVMDILKRVDNNEYKRRQAAPGLRVTAKAFGVGRRLPIVMRWDRDMMHDVLHTVDDHQPDSSSSV